MTQIPKIQTIDSKTTVPKAQALAKMGFAIQSNPGNVLVIGY